MRMRALVIIVAALLFSANVGTAAQSTTGPIDVFSAKRTKEFVRPNQTVSARDANVDVVVALRIHGIPREEFLKTDDETVYVMAGEEKLPPAFVAAGRIDGMFELLVVFVGPKSIRNMTLHYGAFPQVSFTAEEAIAERLP